MGKSKAIVTVNSVAVDDKESQIEIVSVGTFEKCDDKYILEYDETELSGMEGTKTTIIIQKDSFSLMRQGTIETNMEFKSNKENVALYKTPYGIIDMKTFTKKLKIDINEKGGIVDVLYTIIMEGQQNYDTRLFMKIAVGDKE